MVIAAMVAGALGGAGGASAASSGPGGLVLRTDGLGVVDFGITDDEAIATLTALLGAPSGDTTGTESPTRIARAA